MNRILLISSGPGELRAGLVEDGRMVELYLERSLQPSLLGAVFLARIVSVERAIPAAFVDLGGKSIGFLPLDRVGSADYPLEGSSLVVQISKEARGDKPPEVTRAISLNGRYLAYLPGRPGVAASRRLPSEERQRLSDSLEILATKDEGVVARTHAEGAQQAQLEADLARLRQRFGVMTAKARSARAPCRLDPVPHPAAGLLARIAPVGLNRLIVDRAALTAEIQGTHFADFALPPIETIEAAFADHGFEEQWDAAINPRIDLAGGAWLDITECEAACLVDVNLGTSGRGRADAASLEVNLQAAAAIADQIRLRNISGAIIIDFITMRDDRARRRVEQHLRTRAREILPDLEIHGWTRLGNLELTRKRRFPSVAEQILERGAMRRPSPQTVAYRALRVLARLPPIGGPVTLAVHPQVAALLRSQLEESLAEASRRCGRKILVNPDPCHELVTFDIAGA